MKNEEEKSFEDALDEYVDETYQDRMEAIYEATFMREYTN